MFFTYLGRELRRRMRQAIFAALGLAVGIGLVITVTAASAGVRDAQSKVLHSLYGVGTDITVTKAPPASLADNLGRWLAVAVLVAAFLLASLLMIAAVSHRVREFGTLKALGWRSRRIVGQVMGEAVVIGVAGGIIGVALGFAGARLVAALAPPLTASTGTATGSATPGGPRAFGPPGGGAGPGGGGGGFFRRLFGDGGTSLSVHLSAPVTVGAVALAVALAIAGGLIAGGFGSWRAARLRPAAALARVQ